jgi:phosphopantetheinyl transferase (holo-ACP synthase)
MTLTTHTQQLLNRIQELLSITEDEIVQRGITEAATARIVELRQRGAQLADRYASLEALEARVKSEGVTPDDHTPYTDLLEWRAVRHELAQLTGFLEAA